MLTRPLPNDPSLEHLRKEAKRLRGWMDLADILRAHGAGTSRNN